jgi:hypothetical protein
MPIPFPGTYDTLCAIVCKGAHVPFDGLCEGCSCHASYYFVGYWVNRSAVFRLSGALFLYEILRIPLARCIVCKRWARVLPCELLAHKVFGWTIIEYAMTRYTSEQGGLRKSVLGLVAAPHQGPSFTTLWWWLAGVGEKTLDRNEYVKHHYPPTSSTALAESSLRSGIDVCAVYIAASAYISPRKYRSEQRQDQLLAVMRLLIVAAALFAPSSPQQSDLLQQWNVFLHPWFHVTVWDFPTNVGKTAIQHLQPP